MMIKAHFILGLNIHGPIQNFKNSTIENAQMNEIGLKGLHIKDWSNSLLNLIS